MPKTRSQSSASKTRKQIYRKRVKASLCRGKPSMYCRTRKGCKSTKGSASRKSYCRKKENKHV